MEGPATAAVGDTFNVAVVAQNLPDPGLYGVQFEVNYDPALLSVANLQTNSDLALVVIKTIDPVNGKITLVASRQGRVPGLTGNISLLTFEATAQAAGTTTLTFTNEKIGSPQAEAFDVIAQSYTVVIGEGATPQPTNTPEPTGTVEPTTTVEPTNTPEPTGTVEPTTTVEPTNTPEPTTTVEPTTTTQPTATPTPANTTTPEPTTTVEPTNTPEPTTTLEPTTTVEPTGQPTNTPTPIYTVTPGPTVVITLTVTPEPTDEPTVTPTVTVEPTIADVSGQVILAGRAGNDWSGATVTVADSGQDATTAASGNFTISGVPSGSHSSITADAPGYLSALCTNPTITAPETTLNAVSLVSGDIDGDDVVDITDATAVGVGFGSTGPDLLADINRDEVVDIFDLILVSVNFGETGPQTWECLSE
jgi:hypothetical protein